jgi:hypothetical protein
MLNGLSLSDLEYWSVGAMEITGRHCCANSNTPVLQHSIIPKLIYLVPLRRRGNAYNSSYSFTFSPLVVPDNHEDQHHQTPPGKNITPSRVER